MINIKTDIIIPLKISLTFTISEAFLFSILILFINAEMEKAKKAT